MIKKLIESYRRIRTEHALSQTCRHQYAFVGMGQHSLTNLYPVLFSLQVPLKYICVTTARKARLIGTKYAGIESTTSLQRIWDDETVKGVFGVSGKIWLVGKANNHHANCVANQ